MNLDLNEIAHSLGMRYTYEVDTEASDDITSGLAASGVKLHEPVSGKLTLTNTGGLLLARGNISTALEMECVRCLTGFAVQMNLPVEEQFPLHVGAFSGDPHENVDSGELMVEGDLDIADAVFQDNILDLTELIRQNLLVNAPLAPLCREACKGLCRHCGHNLNQSGCACPPDDEEDSRPFSEALKDWGRGN